MAKDKELAPVREGKTALTAQEQMTELLMASIEKGDVDVIEKMVALSERAEARTDKADFYTELAVAKAEFPEIQKTYQGVHTSRKGGKVHGNYAPLEEITRCVEPILNARGFTIRWDREKDGDTEYVVFILARRLHEQRSRFPAMTDEGRGRTSIQSVASGETYAKRYSMIAGLGLTTVDPSDDDGARSEERGPPAGSESVSDAQESTLVGLLDKLGAETRDGFLRAYGIEAVGMLPAAAFDKARGQLNVRLDQKREAEGA